MLFYQIEQHIIIIVVRHYLSKARNFISLTVGLAEFFRNILCVKFLPRPRAGGVDLAEIEPATAVFYTLSLYQIGHSISHS